MPYHKVVQTIVGLLNQRICQFDTFEHEPVRTSEEASKVRNGYTLEQGAKALIVRAKNAGNVTFYMLVVPGHLRFDAKKAKRVIGTKDLRFATEEEVSIITNGVQVGGVPPFGNVFNLKVIADPKVFAYEKIVFNAGDRRFSIGMKSADYKSIVKPTIEDITI